MTKSRFAIIGNQAFSMINFRAPLIEAIARQGHDVFVLTPDFDGETRGKIRACGATPVDYSLSRTGLNPVRDFFDIVALQRLLAHLQIDTVLSFAIKPVIYGTLAASFAGVPNRYALIAGLGYAFADDARSSPGRLAVHHAARILYKTALAKANNVFLQNPDDVRDFLTMKLLTPEKVVQVNGTGVDLDKWPELPPQTHPVTFMLAARLIAEKGIQEYVEAARIIKAGAPNTRFVVLGGLDSNPNAIERGRIEQWVDEGLIEWPGHVPVGPRLKDASVYVLPSYYREGIPRSIQEALASGRPIITTNAPGCRETVINGENGYLVEPRDVEGLAAAMRRFVDSPRLIAKMGKHSRRLAERKFDINDVNMTMITTMGLT